MITCPNKNLPEWKELENTVPDMAYTIWDLNNGNGIDRAPNGAPSILFNSLLLHYKGNREEAIKAKAKVYSSEFLNWFGDWFNEDKTNVSKVVDENGEPLVLYHGTKYMFDEFEIDKEYKRGAHKIHPNVAFWFTDTYEKAKKYQHAIVMPVFLNMKVPAYTSASPTNINNTSEESKLLLDDKYDSVIIDRYDKEGEIGKLTRQWAVKNPNQIKSIDNIGLFSLQDNNIYYNITSTDYDFQFTVNKSDTDSNVDSIVKVLLYKFPQLKVEWIDALNIPQGIRLDANSFVMNDTVYLVRGRVNEDMTVEEFLHPLVNTIYGSNKPLFDALLDSAYEEFKELREQINSVYTDEKGFTELDRLKELVTQALSIAYNNKNKLSKFRQIANAFWAWIQQFIYNITNGFHSELIIPSKLRKMNIQLLSNFIYNSNKQFIVEVNESVNYNLSNNDLQQLRTGIKQRINALKRYKSPDLRQIQQLDKLYNDLSTIDSVEGIIDFINYVDVLMKNAVSFLNKSVDDINSKQIVQLKRDFLSFFVPVMKQIQYAKDTDVNMFKGLSDEFRIEITKTIDNIVNQQTVLLNKYDNIIKYKLKLFLLDYGQQAGSPTIQNLVDNLDNLDLDITWIGYVIGQNSSSSSEIVRIVTDIIMNQLQLTARQTFAEGMTLVNKLKEVQDKVNDFDLRWLQEHDNEGKTTGYFVQPVKYGVYERDEKQFIEKLQLKFNVTKDQDGKLVFENNDQERLYKNELLKWRLYHANMLYNKDYYMIKQQILSTETQEALDEVQNAINDILKLARENNVLRLDKLTDSELALLDLLYQDRAALYSDYNVDGTPKSGTELKIAQELLKFKDKIDGGIEYEIDVDKYRRDAVYMGKKYGYDSKQYKKWYLRSTEEEYTQEFYDLLEKILTGKSEELKKLYRRRSVLLAPYKTRGKKEIELDIPLNIRKEVLEIDKQINKINSSRQVLFEDMKFSDFAEIVKTEKYFEDADKAKQEGTYEKWYAENHYENLKGYVVPASYYTYMKPLKDRFIVRVPNKYYRKLDVNSRFANPEFDSNGPSIQPNKKFYDNSQEWNRIQKNKYVKELYDMLISEMNKHYSYFSFIQNVKPGLLPQITGRWMATLRNSNDKFETLKYMTKDTFSVKDDDVDYVKEYEYRNDGTPIRLIPTRFMKRLEDPSTITTDVIGSVILFIEMANNYQNMSLVLDDLEMVLYGLENVSIRNRSGLRRGKDTNIYKKIDTLYDMALYGRHKKQIKIKGVNVTKALSKIYQTISLTNLAFNPWSITSGYVTAQGNIDMEAICGKYFDASDMAFAKKEFLRRFGNITVNIGNVNHKDKLMQLMQINQVVRSNQETFDRLDLSALLRGLNQHFWYNGYTAGDFVVKSQLLLSVYHSYRMINGKIYNKEQYISKSGKDRKTAIAEFESALKTLWDLVEVKDGQIVSDKISQSELNKINKLVYKKLQVMASRIDGNITSVDRTVIHQNAITQFFVMHRNFMISGFQERLKKKLFNYATGQMEGGVYMDFLKYSGTFAKCIGQIFSQGKINFIANAVANYHNLDSLELYNVRRTLLDLLNIAIWGALISTTFAVIADLDDDNWTLLALAYITARIAFEFRTLYNPIEITNLLNSPSAAISSLNNLFSIIKLINPSTYIGDRTPFSTVKSGAYENWPRILRNIFKLTPLKNIYEAFDVDGVKSKRNYLENQLMF